MVEYCARNVVVEPKIDVFHIPVMEMKLIWWLTQWIEYISQEAKSILFITSFVCSAVFENETGIRLQRANKKSIIQRNSVQPAAFISNLENRIVPHFIYIYCIQYYYSVCHVFVNWWRNDNYTISRNGPGRQKPNHHIQMLLCSSIVNDTHSTCGPRTHVSNDDCICASHIGTHTAGHCAANFKCTGDIFGAGSMKNNDIHLLAPRKGIARFECGELQKAATSNFLGHCWISMNEIKMSAR